MTKFKDLSGIRYGKLIVVELSHINKGKSHWKCLCNCGNYCTIRTDALKSGKSVNCSDRSKINNAKNKITHGKRDSKLYSVWSSMKDRCNNSRNSQYVDYGCRGIRVCDEWVEFKNFYEWSILYGYKEGLSIDRVDNDGNYEPSNCRWVTMKVQSSNKRNSRYIEYNGERKTLSEWSRRFNVSVGTLNYRLKKFNDDMNLVVKSFE